MGPVAARNVCYTLIVLKKAACQRRLRRSSDSILCGSLNGLNKVEVVFIVVRMGRSWFTKLSNQTSCVWQGSRLKFGAQRISCLSRKFLLSAPKPFLKVISHLFFSPAADTFCLREMRCENGFNSRRHGECEASLPHRASSAHVAKSNVATAQLTKPWI